MIVVLLIQPRNCTDTIKYMCKKHITIHIENETHWQKWLVILYYFFIFVQFTYNTNMQVEIQNSVNKD